MSRPVVLTQEGERDPWVRMMKANADIQYYIGIHRRRTSRHRGTSWGFLRTKKGV